MVTLAAAVDFVECAHALEAGVRELRLLAAHAPPYNRRSRFPHRWWWLVLTDEAFPRFAVVRAPRQARAIGPFRSRAGAVDTAALLARVTGLRTCTTRLGRSARHGPACPEREVAPCPAARGVCAIDYAGAPLRAAALIDGVDNAALAAACRQDRGPRRARPLRVRGATAGPPACAIDGLWRGQRLRALAELGELVAAAPDGSGGWHIAVVRHGQLAGAVTAPRGVPPMPLIDVVCAGGADRAGRRCSAGRRAGRGNRVDRPVARGARRSDRARPSPATRCRSAQRGRGPPGRRWRARRNWRRNKISGGRRGQTVG